VRVIAHGKGIGLLRKTDTALAERIASLAASGVQFAACENTMKRLTLTNADLLPAVGTVDSGVAEILRLQSEGWAYLQAGG
jgi:intracellular sulfur oxidation DsrE/DsrF family protein